MRKKKKNLRKLRSFLSKIYKFNESLKNFQISKQIFYLTTKISNFQKKYKDLYHSIKYKNFKYLEVYNSPQKKMNSFKDTYENLISIIESDNKDFMKEKELKELGSLLSKISKFNESLEDFESQEKYLSEPEISNFQKEHKDLYHNIKSKKFRYVKKSEIPLKEVNSFKDTYENLISIIESRNNDFMKEKERNELLLFLILFLFVIILLFFILFLFVIILLWKRRKKTKRKGTQ